jgi:hypothetical protein
VQLSTDTLNLEHLLRLRLAIARLGEMDNAGWWNINGLLGSAGAFVMKRGFPRTFAFVQARASFAVAATKCQELLVLPQGATLWRLPAAIEDEFEDRWQTWLDEVDRWQTFFAQVSSIKSQDVLGTLLTLELITHKDVSEVQRLKRAVEGYSLELPISMLDNTAMRLLAAGFAFSEPGKPIVPYVRVDI